MEYNIYKNRRNYGDSPAYLNPLGFLAGNPATLVVGGSDRRGFVIMGLIIVLKDNHNPLKSYSDNNMLILISTFAVLVAIFTRMTFEMP